MGDIPNCSPRELAVLIQKLPEKSRYQAELAGGSQFIGWDYERYVSVQQLNVLQQMLYVLVRTNSKSPVQRPKHIPVPTPKSVSSAEQKEDNGFLAMAARARANRRRKLQT